MDIYIYSHIPQNLSNQPQIDQSPLSITLFKFQTVAHCNDILTP